eukprot:TRINITY_DN1588_c0_g1_i1.p1 TRINITY_DN1588_c0_g1~~TRINITY_DN1588_c0_g1_i1.p1  ORF type:complete len:619 (-),score=193.72 TRINITY_DN1588_c0_g1_i1:59-1915(-)
MSKLRSTDQGLRLFIQPNSITSTGSAPMSARKGESFLNYLYGKEDESLSNAKMTIRVESGDKIFEHVVEASPIAIKGLSNKLFKPMKKYPHQQADKDSRRAFGVSLRKYMTIHQVRHPHDNIPPFIQDAISLLLRKGLSVEGLFRRDGSKTEMKQVIDCINCGEESVLNDASDAVFVADLIKTYIQELPEPLISATYYPAYLAVSEISTQAAQVDTLRKIISCLPQCHQDFLHDLLALFYQVSLNSSVNAMSCENIAIVFCPILAWKKDNGNVQEMVREAKSSAKVLTLAIQEYVQMFPNKHSDLESIQIKWPQFRKKIVGHQSTIQAVVTTHDKKNVWSADHLGCIRVYDSNSCIVSNRIQTQRGIIFSMVATEKAVWVGSVSGLQLFNPQTAEAEREISSEVVLALIKIDSSVWAATDTKLSCFNAETFALEREVRVDDGGKRINALAYSQKHGFLLLASGNDLLVFSLQSQSVVKVFKGAHQKRINAVKVSGACAWTASDDSHVNIWNLENFSLVHQLEFPSAVLGLSVFGTHVWSCEASGAIRLWDSSTFEKLHELHSYHTDGIVGAIPVWVPSQSKSTSATNGNSSSNGKFYAWTHSCDSSICVWETPYKLGV